jgi:hypothetical protein
LKFKGLFRKSIKFDYLTQENTEIVNEAWESISNTFRILAEESTHSRMDRQEVSFHDQVKLLGHLCLVLNSTKGDLLEIGVWKGKSLALMSYFSTDSKVIGIDPLEFKNQKAELLFFKEAIFPSAIIIEDYAEYAVQEVVKHSTSFKMIHIDGGHEMRNVVLDFLLYSPMLICGGFLVFDDYGDHQFSPNVKPAVDLLISSGLVKGFEVIGQLLEFPNSFILRKN